MSWSVPIGRIRGFPIRVHLSVLVPVLLLLYEPLILRDKPALVRGAIVLALGAIAILGHELAHALVALRYRARVHGIVLWPLGGLTELSDVPQRPWAEAVIALAGPFANLALAGVGLELSTQPDPVGAYANLFAHWNLLLFVLNLLPVQPLDGGHVVRAVLRARVGPPHADLWAGAIGVLTSLLVLALGLYRKDLALVLVALFAALSSHGLMRQAQDTFEPPDHADAPPEDDHAWKTSRRELESDLEQQRAADQAERDLTRRVDQLLQQISERGVRSLSADDRAFLQRASERLRERRK